VQQSHDEQFKHVDIKDFANWCWWYITPVVPSKT